LFESRAEPIVVTYTGGYDLPDEAPPALKQALELMIREEQAYTGRLSMSGIRSISHKEARVMFYDPFSGSGQKAVSGGMNVALSPAASALLSHYTRLEC